MQIFSNFTGIWLSSPSKKYDIWSNVSHNMQHDIEKFGGMFTIINKVIVGQELTFHMTVL